MSSYPPSTGGGFNCGTCGAWVPFNTVHTCPGQGWHITSVPEPPPDRLADALERIATALERIAASREPS